MIQKLGNAMKKMAQRSMWRGNRGDAHAIENHGMYGMRSNNQANAQNANHTQAQTNTAGTSQMHSNTTAVNIKNTAHTTNILKKDDDQNQSGLGGSIMGALQ